MNNAIKFSRIIGNNALFTVSNSCFWALKCQVLWLSRYMTLAKSLIVSIFKFIKLTLYTQPKNTLYIYICIHTTMYIKNIYLYSEHYDHQNTTPAPTAYVLSSCIRTGLCSQCVPGLDMEVGSEGIVGFGGQRQNLFGNISKWNVPSWLCNLSSSFKWTYFYIFPWFSL